eukprot:TRINITY_DN39124_c1_g1_i1.p1 TRINITY_DN39124_c1_g1~~TRINITY_DN39124_c1_g1_i1.p1  ORF type:complete len:136 (-),score=14.87 TRINITY_DN39124_c1_g1_i1:26-433(-)
MKDSLWASGLVGVSRHISRWTLIPLILFGMAMGGVIADEPGNTEKRGDPFADVGLTNEQLEQLRPLWKRVTELAERRKQYTTAQYLAERKDRMDAFNQAVVKTMNSDQRRKFAKNTRDRQKWGKKKRQISTKKEQ